MMESSTDAQKSTEAFARRAEQEAKRDAIVKARLQAEADSIDGNHAAPCPSHGKGRPRAEPNRSHGGTASTGSEGVPVRLTTSRWRFWQPPDHRRRSSARYSAASCRRGSDRAALRPSSLGPKRGNPPSRSSTLR